MSYRPVIVDQRLGSSPASSGRTTPSVNSLSPSPSPSYSSSSSYRQYGAPNHTATVNKSGGTVVINHGGKGYQQSSPSPNYGGSYPRRP